MRNLPDINRFKLISLVIFLLVTMSMSAQYFENPSFEGPAGIGVVPPHWLPFDPLGTPDTEPLDCDDFTASDGDSYITLVMHGSGSPQYGINENCQAALLRPLEEGTCYRLSVDLASRDDLGHYSIGKGFIYYREEVFLQVYGSGDPRIKGELLAESGIVYGSSWETHSLAINPAADIEYITLEVSALGNPEGNGNLLLDRLQISDLLETRTMLNDTIESTELPYTLTASESPVYSWTPEEGLSCYDCRSPEVISPESRTYTCRIEDTSSGCALDEIFILTIINVDPPPPVLPGDFRIPDVFTPNGDGVNDVFEIRGLLPNSSLRIFDRSGRELYSSDNYDNNWDGRDKDGRLIPEGNYWYVLELSGLKERHRGNVYLKRE